MARTMTTTTKATKARRAVRARAAEDKPAPKASKPTLASAMGFSGPAPEKINGRLAMVAFVAAAGAELSTHESVAQQFGDAPLPIIVTAATFSVASLVPILKGAIDEPAGPLPNVFNSNVETLNGRVAMLGLAGLLVTEYLSGQATF